MVTDVDSRLREMEERLSSVIAGWMPKNALRSVTDGHVHRQSGVGAPISVFSAQELVRGAANIRFHGPLSPASGDIAFSPGGIQRARMFTSAHDGGAIEYAPVVDLAAAITTTTQTVITLNVAGPANGQHIRIGFEAMLVLSGGGTTSLTVGRARLLTTAATHNNLASVLRVNVESVMQVDGGLRATGGVAFTDLALQGYSTHELEIRATFTEPIPTYADGQTEFGRMTLQRAGHSHATDVDYAVEIDTQGAPGYATFRWSDDGGATWDASLVAIPEAASSFISLQSGVTISFSYGSYFVGNRWDFTAIGTDNQVELLRADTVNDVLYLRNVEIDATTGAYTRNFYSRLNYTGTAGGIEVVNATFESDYAGTGVASSSVGLALYPRLGTTANTPGLTGLRIDMQTSAAQSGTVNAMQALQIAATYSTVKPTSAVGITIGDLGHASISEVVGLLIGSQTAGSVGTINIHQAGLTGVNRLAARTLIGADASPAAGVALELRGGALRLAETPYSVIQDEFGNAQMQLGGGYGVDFLGTGLSAALGHVALFGNSGAVTVDVPYAGHFVMTTTSSDFGEVIGVVAGPVYTGAGALVDLVGGSFSASQSGSPGAITNQTAVQAYAGGGSVSPTDARAFYARTGQWSAAVKPVTAIGFDAENMGRLSGTGAQIVTVYGGRIQGQRAATLAVGLLVQAMLAGTTGIGIDVEAQTAAGTDIGVRIAGASNRTLELSSTSGAAPGGLWWSTDTNLYRSAASVLKTDDKLHVALELELDGDLNHDGANVGFRGVAPVALSSAYTPTNVTTDRSWDCNATSTDELADVLATVVADLQLQGLLG